MDLLISTEPILGAWGLSFTDLDHSYEEDRAVVRRSGVDGRVAGRPRDGCLIQLSL